MYGTRTNDYIDRVAFYQMIAEILDIFNLCTSLKAIRFIFIRCFFFASSKYNDNWRLDVINFASTWVFFINKAAHGHIQTQQSVSSLHSVFGWINLNSFNRCLNKFSANEKCLLIDGFLYFLKFNFFFQCKHKEHLLNFHHLDYVSSDSKRSNQNDSSLICNLAFKKSCYLKRSIEDLMNGGNKSMQDILVCMTSKRFACRMPS